MQSISFGRIKVLVIEENPDDQELLTHWHDLITEKHLVTECRENLQAGIEAIKTNDPDVILLDLSLPDSFGIATVKNVQKRFPSLPIIVLTGSDDDVLALQAIDAGAQDYLVKGEINAALLKRSINYSIERHRSLLLRSGRKPLWRIQICFHFSNRRWRCALVESRSRASFRVSTP
jgi:two-component system cell cycle response regulator